MALSSFRVLEAQQQDLPALMTICNQAFGHLPVEEVLGNLNTPEARKASGERHLQAWREHAKVSAQPCAIKCVHTDADSNEAIVGFAEWFIFDRPRSEEQYRRVNFLLSGSWLSSTDQEKVTRWMKPMIDARIRWMAGRPHAVFMYMCVDKAWRRQGASTLCVRWGIEKCKELGIPAYLEASDEGAYVYKKLGFEDVENVTIDMDGIKVSFPVMILWPSGTSDKDKKPALQ